MKTFYSMTLAVSSAIAHHGMGPVSNAGARKASVTWVLLSLFCLLGSSGCQRDVATLRLSGHTMGTVWHAAIVDTEADPAGRLAQLIQAQLDAVDAAMSTYNADSDLARFNRVPVAECIKVSPHTWLVTQVAMEVSRDTGNAFNPGVSALVELWGFGVGEPPKGLPQRHEVDRALQASRLSQLMLDGSQSALCKKGPIQLDYSAIAKGYGVDQVAALLEKLGHQNFLVEVGGEVKTAGLNASRERWRIGIERPQLLQGEVLASIGLSGEAVATSGDYRNYRTIDEQRYSHTIDPQTGYPVTHHLASVTVVAPSAILADAYATALNVMGPEKGLAFATKRALPVYMVVKTPAGFETLHSPAFEPYLRETR
jgi:thiamine biosynthesis lipoprotein